MMTEADLRRAILCDRAGYVGADDAMTSDCPGDCLAHALGYRGMYVTSLRTKRGHATPTRGDLGAGWPDLLLVRERRGKRDPRRIAAELKVGSRSPTPEQMAVGLALSGSGFEVYVWRPTDLDSGTIIRTMMEDVFA